MAPQEQLLALDVDLAQLEAVALLVQAHQRLDRLLAEVAARARVDDDLGHAARRARAGGPALGGEGVVAEVVGIGDRLREAGGGADHRRVVGAEPARDQLQGDAPARAELGDCRAQRAVGGDAAAERDRLPSAPLQRPLQLRGQLPDDGRLEGGGEVGAARGDALGPELAAEVDEGRLEAAEAEVEAGVAGHRDRHLEGAGSPSAAASSSAGPPGKPSPSSRADLSKASPAASSRVWPRTSWPCSSARRRAGCGRRSRPGRGRGARAARARGSWRRRGPAGGRPGSAAVVAPRRSPWRC